ncbi:MAG: hypothetical protein JRJ62_12695 [Deltaproteobacteria bacterium]|nr:hypothetical protein [Deltaproteobacteria bacterium]
MEDIYVSLTVLLMPDNLLPNLLNNRLIKISLTVLPFVMYFLLTLPLFDWLIDDAGISFAYARSFAHGHGLTAQPGSPPVEGYSNFLWVLVMAFFFFVKLFHLYITPKIVSLILIAVTFYLLHKSVLYFTGRNIFVSFVALISLALNASFIIWTCSGLENALYATLIVLLFYVQLNFIKNHYKLKYTPYLAAVISAAIALTRPDGIVYAAVFPATMLISLFARDKYTIPDKIAALIKYAVVFLILWFAFLLFRHLYFGDIYPNTYHAKGGPGIDVIIPTLTLQEPYLTRLGQLLQGVFGTKLKFLIPCGMIVMATSFYSERKMWRELTLLLTMLTTTAFVFMVMPDDWMGEFRFATPFFPFIYISLAILLAHNLRKLTNNHKTLFGVGLTVSVLFLALCINVNKPRLTKFYKNPVVAFENVANSYAHKFNSYAEQLELEEASILLPDIGATLYYSNLRVYDLAALTDKTIARTLRKNMPAFYNYIFEVCHPTFIHTHGNWTYAARLDDDERFRRDYVPISEYRDKWIESKTGRIMMSGDFIRKDVIAGREDILDLIRNNKK